MLLFALLLLCSSATAAELSDYFVPASHIGWQGVAQGVLGPMQDDEALLLYALVQASHVRRVLEIGGLGGFSAFTLVQGMHRKPNSAVYTMCVSHFALHLASATNTRSMVDSSVCVRQRHPPRPSPTRTPLHTREECRAHRAERCRRPAARPDLSRLPCLQCDRRNGAAAAREEYAHAERIQ